MKIESCDSVWDAIAASPTDAANLKARSNLMMAIAETIQKAGWTRAEAAKHFGITQLRTNDLLRGRISRFSLDALVNITSRGTTRWNR